MFTACRMLLLLRDPERRRASTVLLVQRSQHCKETQASKSDGIRAQRGQMEEEIRRQIAVCRNQTPCINKTKAVMLLR